MAAEGLVTCPALFSAQLMRSLHIHSEGETLRPVSCVTSEPHYWRLLPLEQNQVSGSVLVISLLGPARMMTP